MNNKQPLSIWSAYLDKSYKDPDAEYKEKIAVKTEMFIGELTDELLKKEKLYTPEVAKKMAINVVMEQMLSIQYENSPKTQKAMLINLFCEHPSTLDFKVELYELYKRKQKEKSLIYKIKKLFK